MSSTQSNKRKAAQWFSHVEKWRASGVTRSAYCLEHGLTVHAFGYWIKRHRTQGSAATNNALMLIPTKVIAQHGEGVPSELILVCPNGSKLYLPTTTPATWLGTLLGQLR